MYKYIIEKKLKWGINRVVVPISAELKDVTKAEGIGGEVSAWFLCDDPNHQNQEHFKEEELNLVGPATSYDDAEWDYVTTLKDGTFIWHILTNKTWKKVE